MNEGWICCNQSYSSLSIYLLFCCWWINTMWTAYSCPFLSNSKHQKKFVLTKETKKEKGRLIQLFFCTLGSISHQLLIGHGSWHDRQKCHNKWEYCTIKKHAHLNWGTTQVDLWMSLSIFSWPVTRILHVWGRRQTKSKTERRALLLQPQLHTHTHTI